MFYALNSLLEGHAVMDEGRGDRPFRGKKQVQHMTRIGQDISKETPVGPETQLLECWAFLW